MIKSVHQEIFDLYEIFKGRKAYTQQERTALYREKEKVRKTINRLLKKAFKEKEWDELTELDRKRFLCITVRETILKNYVIGESKQARIKRKIDQYASHAFIEAQETLLEYNERAAITRKYFYPETTDESLKKRAYNDFRHALEKYYSYFPVPSYEEWVSSNDNAIKRGMPSLRIYDYIMSNDYPYKLEKKTEEEAEKNEEKPIEEKPIEEFIKKFVEESVKKLIEIPTEEPYVPQQTIDHYILATLLKALKESHGIEIDVDKIKKCLVAKQAMQERNPRKIDELLLKHDPSLSIDRETQQQMIDQNIEYQMCLTALEKLDFIK